MMITTDIEKLKQSKARGRKGEKMRKIGSQEAVPISKRSSERKCGVNLQFLGHFFLRNLHAAHVWARLCLIIAACHIYLLELWITASLPYTYVAWRRHLLLNLWIIVRETLIELLHCLLI